jgi:hypothetical protein
MSETDRDRANRRRLRAALARMERLLATAIGRDKTAQLREYIEHHEFGLALELLTALVRAEKVDPGPYAAGVAEAAERMGMSGSGDLSEWRRHLDATGRTS